MPVFRASATISWNFETSDDPLEAINDVLNKIKKEAKNFHSSVKFVELKEKIKIGEFKVEDVLPFIGKGKKKYELNGKSYPVKMNSQRYFLFKHNTKCVCCGLEGTKMFLEYHPSDNIPHFNLYGEENNKLILMTKDHIRAKAFGGENKYSNYQIMCLTCNNLKGHSNINLKDLRLLRNLLNENRNKLSKKKLHYLIEEARSKIQQPWQCEKTKVPNGYVVTSCDIFAYETQDMVVGKTVYEIEEGYKQIGCIKRGTSLEPLMATKDKIMCKITDSEEIIILNLGHVVHK